MAILSFVAYSWYLGWEITIGIMVLISFHELGHIVVLRQQGLESSPPVFIPLVGAFIIMPQPPRSAADEAWVGLGGPLLGAGATCLALLLAFALQSATLFAVTGFGLAVNLFNLLPISPLDGGRAAGVLPRSARFAATATVVAATLQLFSPWVIAIAAIEVTLLRRLSGGSRSQTMTYRRTTAKQRRAITTTYVVLIAALVVGILVLPSDFAAG